MIYPKKGTFEKSSKGRNTKYLRAGDDSELKALNQLLHDLDEEIDQKKFGERKKKYDRELDEKTKHKRRKKRNTTPNKQKGQHRDKRLREHTKLKIFTEIERKLFDTRIDNVKLSQFLKVKQRDKKEYVKYEWARDTNVMNLRFFNYLLIEEIETIIDNMDETRGMNYLNSVDAKMQKRNNIINHLLREKAVTAKLMTKVLAIMENTSMDATDLMGMLKHIQSRDRSRVLSKLNNIVEDMKAIEQIRVLSKGYFNEIDFQNLIAAQKGLKDPLSPSHFDQLREIRTTFERVNRHMQISEEYKKLQAEMDIREKNYTELIGRYEQLIADFLNFIGKENFDTAGFSPEDLELIKERYDKMKKEEDSFLYGQSKEGGEDGAAGMVEKQKLEIEALDDSEQEPMPPKQIVPTVKKVVIIEEKPPIVLREASKNAVEEAKETPMKPKKTVKKRRKRESSLDNETPSPKKKRQGRSKKKTKNKRRIKKKRRGSKKKNQYELSDSYRDGFENNSPDMDVEVSRISRSEKSKDRNNYQTGDFQGYIAQPGPNNYGGHYIGGQGMYYGSKQGHPGGQVLPAFHNPHGARFVNPQLAGVQIGNSAPVQMNGNPNIQIMGSNGQNMGRVVPPGLNLNQQGLHHQQPGSVLQSNHQQIMMQGSSPMTGLNSQVAMSEEIRPPVGLHNGVMGVNQAMNPLNPTPGVAPPPNIPVHHQGIPPAPMGVPGQVPAPPMAPMRGTGGFVPGGQPMAANPNQKNLNSTPPVPPAQPPGSNSHSLQSSMKPSNVNSQIMEGGGASGSMNSSNFLGGGSSGVKDVSGNKIDSKNASPPPPGNGTIPEESKVASGSYELTLNDETSQFLEASNAGNKKGSVSNFDNDSFGPSANTNNNLSNNGGAGTGGLTGLTGSKGTGTYGGLTVSGNKTNNEDNKAVDKSDTLGLGPSNGSDDLGYLDGTVNGTQNSNMNLTSDRKDADQIQKSLVAESDAHIDDDYLT